MAEEKIIDIDKVKDLTNLVKNITIAEYDKSIFESISKTYYRENFHSDILAYYLSYDSVKERLIDWINRCFEEKKIENRIDFSLYEGGPDPVREKGRRDITIYSAENKMHAIIIENKSNGAGDRNFQIPRYYEKLVSMGYEVDAVIYLNKYHLEDPDFSSWSVDEIINNTKELGRDISEVNLEKDLHDMRLRLVKATLNRDNGFAQNVIDYVLLDCKSVRVCGVSLEIKQLFENLVRGEYSMSIEETEKLIKEIGSQNVNFNDLTKLIKTLNNLPNILMNYYFSKLSNQENKPYVIKYYNKTKFYMNFDKNDGTQFYIDVYFDNVLENKLTFSGSVRVERNGKSIDGEEYKQLLDKLASCLEKLGFDYVENSYTCIYDYIPTTSVLDSEEVLKEFEKIIAKYNELISCDSAK